MIRSRLAFLVIRSRSDFLVSVSLVLGSPGQFLGSVALGFVTLLLVCFLPRCLVVTVYSCFVYRVPVLLVLLVLLFSVLVLVLVPLSVLVLILVLVPVLFLVSLPLGVCLVVGMQLTVHFFDHPTSLFSLCLGPFFLVLCIFSCIHGM